jgi:formiminotetrahydrofolate cyclodeaminase
MLSYKNQAISVYLNQLASRNPVPGGGSAAALVGALGAALISMAAQYSLGKGKSKKAKAKIKSVFQQSEKLRERLLKLVDWDAEAYLKVVQTRQAAPYIKQAALKKARGVPWETCRLCYRAIQLTPDLVKSGNPHLLSDVKVAVEMLSAAFSSAMFTVEANR